MEFFIINDFFSNCKSKFISEEDERIMTIEGLKILHVRFTNKMPNYFLYIIQLCIEKNWFRDDIIIYF